MPLTGADGAPCGVMTTIDVKIPSLQTGAFGIDDINLGVVFSLAVDPDFDLGVELALGSMFSPFMLTSGSSPAPVS